MQRADQGEDISPGTAKKILAALEASPPSPTARALLARRNVAPAGEIVPHYWQPGQGGLCSACGHSGRIAGDDLRSGHPLGMLDDSIHLP